MKANSQAIEKSETRLLEKHTRETLKMRERERGMQKACLRKLSHKTEDILKMQRPENVFFDKHWKHIYTYTVCDGDRKTNINRDQRRVIPKKRATATRMKRK